MGEMAAGLAHELNQPLAAVTNYARGCIRRLKDQTIEVDGLLPILEEVSSQAIRAGNIIRRLRDLVRRHPTRQERFEITEMIRGTVQLLDPDLRLNGIALQLELGPPLYVAGDPIQIEQVVLNLVKNAIEAMSEGGFLSVGSALSPDDLVEISVSDTGPGLTEGQLETIFDPFVTSKTGGLGMGLAISRSIAEAHRGRLSGSNGQKGGATFRLLLPVSAPAKAGASSPASLAGED
jgi:two-component system sensor histidine kinase TtrS